MASEDAKLTCRLHPGRALELLDRAPYASRGFVCDLCFRVGEGATYHCRVCKYDLHRGCCELQATVRCFAHPHTLALMPRNWHACSGKRCDGCRAPLAGGEWSYSCEGCGFDVHARCAKLRQRIVTAFHPFPLTLLPKSPYPPRHLRCDLCAERMPTDGWVYHCTHCRFDLHPACALLPRDPLCPAHPHRLHSCAYRTFQGRSYACDVCLQLGARLGFRCDQCNFNVHPQCLQSLFSPPSSAGEEAALTVQDCEAPKFKLTAYGVHIRRKESVDPKPERTS